MKKTLNLNDFGLDRTLRSVIHSSRLGEIIVAIEFTYRGETYRVDTPEEVTKLKEHLAKEASEAEKYSDRDELLEMKLKHTKWTPDRFVSLVENVGHLQKEFLIALLGAENGVTADKVRQHLRLPSLMAMAGVQSGLVKQVRALGLEPYDLYQVHISWTENERTRYFTLDEGFRLVAQEEGWPPLKKKQK